MPLSQEQIEETKEVLRTSLRHKFKKYNPEPAYMPFHTRLLGKDRMALYSFIHSLSTNFGTSIFEPMAIALASTKFADACAHADAGDMISSKAHAVIQEIMDGLSTATASPEKRMR